MKVKEKRSIHQYKNILQMGQSSSSIQAQFDLFKLIKRADLNSNYTGIKI